MAKPKRSTSDKAKRPQLNKAPLTNDREMLERHAEIGSDGYDSSHKTSICYNAACPDYRRERHGNEPCGCKRTSIAV